MDSSRIDLLFGHLAVLTLGLFLDQQASKTMGSVQTVHLVDHLVFRTT